MKPLLLLALALASLVVTQPVFAEQRPKVRFILVDDFGSRDPGCYGSTLYETPNMERLAKSGARFTQADVGNPRCVPSRLAFFTAVARSKTSSSALMTRQKANTSRIGSLMKG